MLYLSGHHFPKDPARAAFWFEKAAIRKLANVQFNFSVLHQRGEGVTKNDRVAFTEARPNRVLRGPSTIIRPPMPTVWGPTSAIPARSNG
tara:strand:- start:278 stop:547 length:270 start_codon:yes stop_codon:yes gene_type:complete